MKLAVLFPGIGYRTDKPLLYYAKELAMEKGFEIVEVHYDNFPKEIRGDKEKMKESFNMAYEQTKVQLQDIDFSKYEKLLFISKSIGTAVAAAYAKEYGLSTNNVYFTPVNEAFSFIMRQSGVAFHGTKDPWTDTEFVLDQCDEKRIQCYITDNANHSLETGDVLKDLKILERVMWQTEDYIRYINQ